MNESGISVTKLMGVTQEKSLPIKCVVSEFAMNSCVESCSVDNEVSPVVCSMQRFQITPYCQKIIPSICADDYLYI